MTRTAGTKRARLRSVDLSTWMLVLAFALLGTAIESAILTRDWLAVSIEVGLALVFVVIGVWRLFSNQPHDQSPADTAEGKRSS